MRARSPKISIPPVCIKCLVFLVMNTLEVPSTVNKSTFLAAVSFGSHLPKTYNSEILFLETPRHNLLAQSTTSDGIIHQNNKSMYFQSVENNIKQ